MLYIIFSAVKKFKHDKLIHHTNIASDQPFYRYWLWVMLRVHPEPPDQ